MPAFDEDLDRKPVRKPTHEIGQILDDLSAGELRLRIELLKTEIARLETAISDRERTQAAAAAFFKGPA